MLAEREQNVRNGMVGGGGSYGSSGGGGGGVGDNDGDGFFTSVISADAKTLLGAQSMEMARLQVRWIDSVRE